MGEKGGYDLCDKTETLLLRGTAGRMSSFVSVAGRYRGIHPSPKRDILLAREPPTSPNGKLNQRDPFVVTRELDASIRPPNMTGNEELEVVPDDNIQATPGSIPARAGFGRLKYTIVNRSSQGCGKEAKNLSVGNRKNCWTATGVGTEYVVLKLKETGLVTSVDIDNKDCDGVQIYLSDVNRKKSFKLAKTLNFVAKNRRNQIRIGHVPCRYVKVVFLKNNLRPGPTIYSVRLVGMLSSRVEVELGRGLHDLLVSNSEKVLYESSKPTKLLEPGSSHRLRYPVYSREVGAPNKDDWQ